MACTSLTVTEVCLVTSQPVRAKTVMESVEIGETNEVPPLAWALLVNGDPAFDATFTVPVRGGKLPPPATGRLFVQLVPEQIQPLPCSNGEVKVKPVGRVSCTVTVPLVSVAAI